MNQHETRSHARNRWTSAARTITSRRGVGEGKFVDDARRDFASSDGIHWQFTIEHQQHDDSIAWRAHVWEEDAYRGVLDGRVWSDEPCDADALSSVALKMALDANYLRDFKQATDEAPTDSSEPADDTGVAEDDGIAEEKVAGQNPDDSEGLPGLDPLPSPA